MVTSWPTANAFLRGQLRFLQSETFDVTLACGPHADLRALGAAEGVGVVPLPLRREISLADDARALLACVRLLRELRPDVTNVGTPKAGLLGGTAAWLTRVPFRVYTLHGLRLEGASGPRRLLLYVLELVACRAAHVVICVGPSLRDRAVGLRLVPAGRAVVLGSGSANGVDPHRFAPAVNEEQASDAQRLREQLRLTGPVVGFVGRITADKGVRTLISAFQLVRRQVPGVSLLMVGDLDDQPGLAAADLEFLADADVRHVGHVDDVAPYYRVMDVLALPSRREGLSYVALEAQASAVPVVTTTATGAVDGVVAGVTGELVGVDDAPALAQELVSLLRNPERARSLGRAGRLRVREQFGQHGVWSALEEVLREGAGRWGSRGAGRPGNR